MNSKQFGKWEPVEAGARFGKSHVFLVTDSESESDELFVLKQPKPEGTTARSYPDGRIEEVATNYREEFLQEIKIAAMMDHPNVIKVVDYSLDEESPWMVTEYCKGGTMADTDLSEWTIEEKLELLRLICQGAAYIHSKGYSKADWARQNILLKADGLTPVICDLELCQKADVNEIGNDMLKLTFTFWRLVEGKSFYDHWNQKPELKRNKNFRGRRRHSTSDTIMSPHAIRT